MKKFNFLLSTCMVALMATSFSACSDDPKGNGSSENPEETLKDYHFDLFLSVGKHGGMSQGDGTIVRSVSDLSATRRPLCETGSEL